MLRLFQIGMLFLQHFIFMYGGLFIITYLVDLIFPGHNTFEHREIIYYAIFFGVCYIFSVDFPHDHADDFKKSQDQILETKVTLGQLYEEIEAPWTRLGYKLSKTDKTITVYNGLDLIEISAQGSGSLRIKSKQKWVLPFFDGGRKFKNYEGIKSIIAGIRPQSAI